MSAPVPAMELSGVSVNFGSVRALQDIDIKVYPGEVHCLLGDNGAGKSTLIKVLSGVHKPSKGQILVDGKPVVFRNPRDAQAMAELGTSLLETQDELGNEAREYLLMAAMTGRLARGEGAAALGLWREHRERIRSAASPAFRLLRCHAERASCAEAFSAYAER